MVTTIAISIWVLTVLGYIIFNLFQKNKKLEKIVIDQQMFINDCVANYKQIDLLADKIDKTMWVQSDPEFLGLMEEIKSLQATIKQYTDNR
jgi:hypothetical protein